MKCVKCGQDNPSKALYCMECGAELGKRCSNCNTLCSINAQYCMACGNKFPKSLPDDFSTQSHGEKRLITALFVDISSSTKLFSSISQDEEDKNITIIQDFIDFCRYAAQNYGGYTTDASFRGDGMLILFGVPDSHEDDAMRAIYTAIDIRNTMQDARMPGHIGINTANMIIGDLEITSKFITASGSEIIFPCRIQEKAKKDQILVGEETYNLTKNAFDFKTLSASALKGFSKSAYIYEVIGEKAHPDKVRGIEGLRPEFIGRENELAILKDCVDNLLAGKNQIVSIMGSAGVGKTRLVNEFLKSIGNIRHLEGKCSSIGQSTSYSVFIDILRSYFDISSKDNSSEVKDKIISKIKEILPDRWQEGAIYIESLLTIEYDDRLKKGISKSSLFLMDQERNQISMTIRDLFVNLAKQKPLLLIFDDVNNADDSSMTVISLLMDESINVPLMIICIYRPESEHESWQIAKRASMKYHNIFREIRLTELTQRESLQMLESMLQTEFLPKEVKEKIIEESDGNPFFMEEIVRLFIDKGMLYYDGNEWWAKNEIKDIEIPVTIHSVIQERIDKLNEESHAILKYASVIGRTFSIELLQRILQKENLVRYVRQIEDKEFIYKERAIPEEYRFKYDTTKEIVYQSMLSNELHFTHQRVAEAIEQLYSDRIEEYYEELAYHYTHTDLIPKAIEYSYKAGIKAKDRYAHDTAIEHLEKSLSLMKSQPNKQLEMSIHEALGDIYFTIGNNSQSGKHFRQALKFADKKKDPFYVANLICKLADIYHWQVDYDRAIKTAESGLKILKNQNCNPESLILLEVICRSYRAKGDIKSAFHYANQIEEIIHDVPYFRSIYKAYYEFAFLQMFYGSHLSAENWLKEMEQICLNNNDELGLARCYHGMADLCWANSDHKQAAQYFKKSLFYCERVHDVHQLVEGHSELAHCLVILDDDPDQIESHIKEGMRIAELMASSSKIASVPITCRNLAIEYSYRGETDKELYYFKRAVELGPSDLELADLLCRIEKLYFNRNQHEAFFDFCKQMQKERKFGLQTSLRYWCLQPSSLSADFSQITEGNIINGNSLSELWRWNNVLDKPKYDLIHPDIIEMYASTGNDIAINGFNAPSLIRQVSGDFAFEANMADITGGEDHVGGILLWANERNYIHFGKKLPHTNEMRLGICVNGKYKTIGRGWISGTSLYLRLERREELISVFCDNDENIWRFGGKISFKVNDPMWVGLYVACPSNKPYSVVRFKDVRLFQKESERG